MALDETDNIVKLIILSMEEQKSDQTICWFLMRLPGVDNERENERERKTEKEIKEDNHYIELGPVLQRVDRNLFVIDINHKYVHKRWETANL